MMKHPLFLIATLALVACGGERGGSTDGRGAQAADTAAGGMGNMEGMPMGGGHGAMANMPSMSMMPAMRRHMDSMVAMTPDRMAGMMSSHGERASVMLDAMGADMRGMNMAEDPAWNALTDSVKRDLADLPGLKGKALAERMREHRRRMERLMDAHERMMR